MALYSDYEGTGSIQTGNELVNQLISNVEWGMKDNFLDVPTDCPQRDERMGWTGDTQVFSGTACYLADTYAFYRKYLYDLYKEQLIAGGMVPEVVPTSVRRNVPVHGAMRPVSFRGMSICSAGMLPYWNSSLTV